MFGLCAWTLWTLRRQNSQLFGFHSWPVVICSRHLGMAQSQNFFLWLPVSGVPSGSLFRCLIRVNHSLFENARICRIFLLSICQTGLKTKIQIVDFSQNKTTGLNSLAVYLAAKIWVYFFKPWTLKWCHHIIQIKLRWWAFITSMATFYRNIRNRWDRWESVMILGCKIASKIVK